MAGLGTGKARVVQRTFSELMKLQAEVRRSLQGVGGSCFGMCMGVHVCSPPSLYYSLAPWVLLSSQGRSERRWAAMQNPSNVTQGCFHSVHITFSSELVGESAAGECKKKRNLKWAALCWLPAGREIGSDSFLCPSLCVLLMFLGFARESHRSCSHTFSCWPTGTAVKFQTPPPPALPSQRGENAHEKLMSERQHVIILEI